MAGQTLPKLRLIDMRGEPAAEHETRLLRIDFGPFVRDHRPNLVLTGAVAGFLVGLALWTLLTMVVVAGVDDALGETAPETETVESITFDCADFGAVRALSSEAEARFQSQCGATQLVVQTDTVDLATSSESTVASATNRANCGEIRGTDYLSAEERAWFLSECVNQQLSVR
jgi:hypothetical protein